MKPLFRKRLSQILSLVLSVYCAAVQIYTDNKSLHLFCDGDMFILIDHYGEKRVYFDNGKKNCLLVILLNIAFQECELCLSKYQIPNAV